MNMQRTDQWCGQESEESGYCAWGGRG